VTLQVTAHPSTADIFFNDKFVGVSPQTLRVNPLVPDNTISAAAVECFEHYRELNTDDVKPGNVIEITLDPREKTLIEKRVPKWLRFRRRYPNSPVLMHAISNYLAYIKEIDDAFAEAQELLHITPQWYMAHNQMANVYQLKGDFDKAIICGHDTIRANPSHALGYIGLACIFSLAGDFSQCLAQLAIIDKEEWLIATYAYFGKYCIANDPDFAPISAHRKHGPEFRNLVSSINDKRDRYKAQKVGG